MQTGGPLLHLCGGAPVRTSTRKTKNVASFNFPFPPTLQQSCLVSLCLFNVVVVFVLPPSVPPSFCFPSTPSAKFSVARLRWSGKPPGFQRAARLTPHSLLLAADIGKGSGDGTSNNIRSEFISSCITLRLGSPAFQSQRRHVQPVRGG
jgi:hypothetical protein